MHAYVCDYIAILYAYVDMLNKCGHLKCEYIHNPHMGIKVGL